MLKISFKKIINKTLLTVALLGLLNIAPKAQSNTTRFFISYADESITVAGTAIGFTTTKVRFSTNLDIRAALVSFRVECATSSPCPIRMLTSGTTPTSTVGIIANEGDIVSIYGIDDIDHFLAIRTTANSAKLYVQYSK